VKQRLKKLIDDKLKLREQKQTWSLIKI
jgi:hypothetical protein